MNRCKCIFSSLCDHQRVSSSVIVADVSTPDLYSAPDREVGCHQGLENGLSHFM